LDREFLKALAVLGMSEPVLDESTGGKSETN
jgi:hypothetical protein